MSYQTDSQCCSACIFPDAHFCFRTHEELRSWSAEASPELYIAPPSIQIFVKASPSNHFPEIIQGLSRSTQGQITATISQLGSCDAIFIRSMDGVAVVLEWIVGLKEPNFFLSAALPCTAAKTTHRQNPTQPLSVAIPLNMLGFIVVGDTDYTRYTLIHASHQCVNCKPCHSPSSNRMQMNTGGSRHAPKKGLTP